jgi:hypothetical protein
MGYKAVKERYDIKHLVSVENSKRYGGRCIYIGSPYQRDIIVIRISDAKIVNRYDGGGANENLLRYDEALAADAASGALRSIVWKQDVFERSLPVYSVENWSVAKGYCEEYGWPNTTHDGEVMFDNTHFRTRAEAYRRLLYETRLSNYRYVWRDNFCELKRIAKKLLRNLFRGLWCWLLSRTIGRFIVKTNKLS